MKAGGKDGANTRTGLIYEDKVDLATFIAKQKKYTVKDCGVLNLGECVAHIFKKYAFNTFLETRGIGWRQHLSKQLLPDNAIYVIVNNTMLILEVKTQYTVGSVDEKVQTYDYKKKQYKKLLFQLNMEVEYIYILDEWFRQPKYKDVLDYVISVGCQYYFNYISLQKLGLPIPQ